MALVHDLKLVLDCLEETVPSDSDELRLIVRELRGLVEDISNIQCRAYKGK